MQVNDYGQVSRTERELLELLYQDPDLNIESINLDSVQLVERFNASAKLCNFDVSVHVAETITDSLEEFDKKNQENWYMPIEYKQLDIVDFIVNLCKTDEERIRVAEELLLFEKHNFINVLRMLKYLIDTFRTNNIVWGVGRGSSVASYCLYLLGVHKVDSIKYNLDIHEFLK